MTDFRVLLLAGLSIMACSAANADPADGEAEVLSEHFRQFVDGAIDEGLLSPATETPTPVFRGRLENVEDAVSQSVDSTTEGCVSSDILDLEEYQNIDSYEDYLVWRGQVSSPDKLPDPVDTALVYIVLGLNAEARLELLDMGGADSEFLNELSRLLDNARPVDLEIFERAAACNEKAELWLALAQVVELLPQGGERLRKALPVYQTLPHRLKVRYAALSVPALDRIGEHRLAAKLMNDFTAEQVLLSPQLSLNAAMLDMYQGGLASDERLREYMRSAELRVEAAAALMRNGFPVEPEAREDVVETLLKDVEQVPSGDGITTKLESMFSRPSDISDYETILRMSSLPILQDSRTRDYVATELTHRLKGDFASSDPLANLAAMSAAALNRDLLDSHPDQAEILNSAAGVANRLGLGRVADMLGAGSGGGHGADLDRARLALRMADADSVKAAFEKNPASQEISRLAAIGAIIHQDRAWLELVAETGAFTDTAIADLLEFDAAFGNWILPEQVYARARQITEPELRIRIDRVLNFKDKAQQQTKSRLVLSQIPSELEQIKLALNSNTGGVR